MVNEYAMPLPELAALGPAYANGVACRILRLSTPNCALCYGNSAANRRPNSDSWTNQIFSGCGGDGHFDNAQSKLVTLKARPAHG